MTALATSTSRPVVVAAPIEMGGSAANALTAADLAQLLGSFNEVTARLTATHEALRSEVAGLQAELSEAQMQVERSRRLSALGEMAAGIAHEIRNPLSSIMLYARMLQQDLGELPAQQTTAGKIAGAVSRLEAIVTDVLSFAREMRIRPTEVDAGELMLSALEAARSDGPEWRGLVVKGPDGGGGARAAVQCDPALMHQALLNIIRNAVQAMAEGTNPGRPRVLTLSVGRRWTRDGAGKRRAMVGLCVRDTGPGIAPEVAERLFNPFVTTRAAGTGLGLAIVHRIVDSHGGRVSIRNVSGPGGAPVGAMVEVMLAG